jgi:cytosine/adenosine deaminase-related metal-dependent hydrolase
MIQYCADWVLPIADDPIREGWVAVDEGRVYAVGSGARAECIDLGRVAILPSLVNAHTHLELSYLHEHVPPGECFNDWIRTLMALRREFPADARILAAARDAIGHARASGTGLIGDVSNTLVTVPLLREAGVAAQVFFELIGFNTPDPDARVR